MSSGAVVSSRAGDTAAAGTLRDHLLALLD
jgi:hypothetical protein